VKIYTLLNFKIHKLHSLSKPLATAHLSGRGSVALSKPLTPVSSSNSHGEKKIKPMELKHFFTCDEESGNRSVRSPYANAEVSV